MEFYIQASSPKGSGQYNAEDESLGEAVETAFPLHTESALMVWHHLYISLNYKYDMSVIVNDLVAVLRLLMRPGPGVHEVQWASNTFLSKWDLRWSAADDLTIDAEWTSVVGVPESALQKAGRISMSRDHFVSEWKEPLNRILIALGESGYEDSQIVGLADMRQLHDEIPRRGILYG